MRLLKIGLRNHDPKTVDAAMSRISNRYGEQITNDIVFNTINILMNEEDWSFELEDGEPSPLI
jgi:hypothetical protein